MAVPLNGKGMFIWKIPRCEKGDPIAVAKVAKQANLTHVLVKVANETVAYPGDSDHVDKDLVPAFIEGLKTQGLTVWAWHYVYGYNPAKEAQIAFERIQQLGVDGYVVNAEKEFKEAGKKEAAKRLMAELRSKLPTFPMALSSFRFPALHSTFPWKEFLDRCDFNMPQVYWVRNNNPGDQLRRCLREFQNMNPSRPIFPTGAAYRERDENWQPTSSQILEFMKTAKSLNLDGFNFWEWFDARSGIIQNSWNTIRDFVWDESTLPKDICEKYVAALNKHEPGEMVNLYSSTAVHVTAARTIQGQEPIRKWYSQMFNQLLPNAAFTLTGFSGTGNSRHMTWTAASSTKIVANGNDTFGLLNDKIAYHYSFFNITSV
jgi:hypothetical protein